MYWSHRRRSQCHRRQLLAARLILRLSLLRLRRSFNGLLATASQRRNLLQELFADVALEVDDRAKDIILGEEDAITVSDESYGSPLCFYNVLADHFARMKENGKSILDLIVRLWSQSFASNIFSLLFHKWLFEFQLDNPVVLLRFSSALIQGATNVFWIDIQTDVRRFQSFFQYLLEEVALDSERLKKIPRRLSDTYFFSFRESCFSIIEMTNLKAFSSSFLNFLMLSGSVVQQTYLSLN